MHLKKMISCSLTHKQSDPIQSKNLIYKAGSNPVYRSIWLSTNGLKFVVFFYEAMSHLFSPMKSFIIVSNFMLQTISLWYLVLINFVYGKVIRLKPLQIFQNPGPARNNTKNWAKEIIKRRTKATINRSLDEDNSFHYYHIHGVNFKSTFLTRLPYIYYCRSCFGDVNLKEN